MSEHTSKRKRKSSSKSKDKSNKVIKIEVEDSDSKNNPIVVSFPGGLPEALLADTTSAAAAANNNNNKKSSKKLDRPKFQWQKLSEKLPLGRRVIGFDQNCMYTSTMKGPTADNENRRTKLLVGVYDKKRGVLKIREAASNGNIFALAQTVPKYLKMNEQAGSGNQNLDYSKVFEDFGSAKKKKVLKSRAANIVDIDNVVGAGADSAVMDQVNKGEAMSESNRKALEASKADKVAETDAVNAAYELARRNFLPEYNEHAVEPHKVYNGKKIAGEKAWPKVFGKVKYSMKSDDPAGTLIKSMQESNWCPYVVKLVHQIPTEAADATMRLVYALLANHMMRFYITCSRKKIIQPMGDDRTSYYGIPNDVAARCFELFTTSCPMPNGTDGHAMSKANRDKCLVHILLLLMMAQGDSMKIGDLKPIADDLKVLVNDCGQILRLAGCTITKKGLALAAALKTPLTFPPPPKRGGRV